MTPMKKSNDDAVSPVIGVILMVAITVILAAIIAMFVFSMTDSVGGAKVVGMTVTGGTSNLTDPEKTVDILWQGGKDIATLNGISGSVAGVVFNKTSINPDVGKITAINTGETISGKRVILVGHFSDGKPQILFDKVM